MNNAMKAFRSICLPPLLACSLTLPAFADAFFETDCEIDEHALLGYLMNPGKACGEHVTGADIPPAIKVLDAYWDRDTSNEERFALLSSEYQNELKKAYGLKDGSEYTLLRYSVLPTEHERKVRGYRIKRALYYGQFDDKKSFQFVVEIEWLRGGYQGNRTYVFDMRDFGDRWAIFDVHY